MNRDEVLNALQAHKPTLMEQFGVTGLALFGSFARGQATDRSDVDILVIFDGPATSSTYFGLQFYIEDLLNRRVDLVTDRGLRSELRPYVEREALYV
jgi:predicted nucleotidyltransferase